jgi:tRNA (guanine37-N1)-methyltransferase
VRFDIITIFPRMFDSYFSESILARAQKKKIVEINVHNLRDYTADKHKKVDDTPYGGGAGMVMKIEPIYKAVQDVLNVLNVQGVQNEKGNKNNKTIRTTSTVGTARTILFSAKGKKYTQADARRLAKYDQLIFICGRYEGVDERVAKYVADEEISIGDYVLTGGEIPAMILVDSTTRLLPGVLGNPSSLEEESFSNKPKTKNQKPKTNLEYPQYTKPENFLGQKVPEVLLSGNHEKIKKWRKKHSQSYKHE